MMKTATLTLKKAPKQAPTQANNTAKQPQKQVDVLIIGGGISGLSTAWWLAQKGIRVQVWEKSNHAGGKIKTHHHNGFETEQAASMIMNFKPEVDQFFAHSGLDHYKAKRLLSSENNRYLIHNAQLQALPMSIARLFFSPMWSHKGKLRLLLEPFIGRSTKQNETVSDFIIRRFGDEFLEKAMEPFIAGTLASDPDLACAEQVIPRLTALEKKFGSISAGIVAHKIMGKRTARNPDSFSFTNGMQTLPEFLANEPNIHFQRNRDVCQLIHHTHQKTKHWEIHAQGSHGEVSCQAQHVVLASPASSAAQLIEPLNPSLSQLLNGIEYASLSVVHIGLNRSAIKHSLDGAGFLVPRQEQQSGKIQINGNLWMSSLFAHKAPENTVLLSSYLGGARHPQAIHLSTQESIDTVLHDISPLIGLKAETNPIMGRLDKHPRALPLYHGHYQQRLSEIKQQLHTLPGLHLSANYKGGVSVRDRISCAKETADMIHKQLSQTKNHCEVPQDCTTTFLSQSVLERLA